MTIREMQKSFLQQLNALGPDFTIASEDVVTYINKAIDQFIKSRFEPRNNLQQLGFEQSQIRIDDLKELVVSSEGLDTIFEEGASEDVFIDKVSIPDDYMFLVNVSSIIQYNDSGLEYTLSNDKRIISGTINVDYKEKKIRCKYNQLDDIYQASTDFFNKTKLLTPSYIIKGNEIQVYTDKSFIVDKIFITYIKRPAIVSISEEIDCDLSISTHEEIVELAVNLIRRDFQTGQSQQNANSE